MSKLKVAFSTLGCRTNQYDTEVMKELCSKEFELVPFSESADIYVINTCTVTKRSEGKARQYIRRCARRDGNSLVLVTGCYATVSPEEACKVEGVDVVIGNSGKNRIAEIIKEALKGRRGIIDCSADGGSLDEERISVDREHTRAFVKIQDGCDRFCSFCKTAYARGLPRSKSPESIVTEVKELVKSGFMEVVFTGINLARYGKNGKHEVPSLPEVLETVAKIEGLKRIRLSSINLEGIDQKLLEFFKSNRKACPHLHIPLQSGDDHILERMRRGYSTKDYRERVQYIKDNVEKATFGGDVMVGFPGETEENFENTCRFAQEVGFANLHIFRYSKRPGTAAASFKEQVPEQVKRERAQTLRAIAQAGSRAAKRRFIGKRLQVLVEELAHDQRWRGYTENYLDVHLDGEEERVKPGDILEVEIKEIRGDYLLGVF